MIEYPNILNIIFDKLKLYKIKPIIVGGYIRDTILNINSLDIDIEVYGISSYTQLEKILSEFGDINIVGKKFGVCKLKYFNLDLDFSLPRIEIKKSSGHCGFDINSFSNLDFTTASKRRDFTINSIGYDVYDKKLLDPYNGYKDIKNKILHPVNEITFIEDPLRVFRAIQFASRFNFNLSSKLISLCKYIINNKMLYELSHERVYQEIKKLLLKSKKPSIGLKLIKNLNIFDYFLEFNFIDDNKYSIILTAIDNISKLEFNNIKDKLLIILALLTHQFSTKETISFIQRLTNESNLLKNILSLHDNILNKEIDNKELYILSKHVIIKNLIIYTQALYPQNKDYYIEIQKKSIKLKIHTHKLIPLLQGRDLIKLGLKPSQMFSDILNDAYNAQMNEDFTNYEKALEWLKSRLLS